MTIGIGVSGIGLQSSGTSVTSGLITPSVSGSSLYVIVSQRGGSATFTVNIPTDSNSNTYIRIGTQVVGGSDQTIDRFYCSNPLGGALTVSATGTGTNSYSIFVQEFTGAGWSGTLDQSSTAFGFSTISSGPITISPSASGEALVTFIMSDDFVASIPFVAPSGYTIQQSQAIGNTNAATGAMATIIETSPGTYNATWGTLSGNQLVCLDSFQGLPPPLFTVQPVNQTANIGTTATFTATVTSYGTGLSYQWQQLISGTWTNVGTNSSSYTTGTLGYADNGDTFQVIATDSIGSTNSGIGMVNLVYTATTAWFTA